MTYKIVYNAIDLEGDDKLGFHDNFIEACFCEIWFDKICTPSFANVITIHCLQSRLFMHVLNFFYLHKYTLLRI
jgi:hypothetical protein